MMATLSSVCFRARAHVSAARLSPIFGRFLTTATAELRPTFVAQKVRDAVLAKKRELGAFKDLPKELYQGLITSTDIDHAHNSTAIEGNSLSLTEASLVVEKGITIGGKLLRDYNEVVDYAETLQTIRALALQKTTQMSNSLLCELHALLMKRTAPSQAGVFRKTFAMPALTPLGAYPNPAKIAQLMDEFERWLQNADTSDPLKLAADAHFNLVYIHPFSDGNGRVSRVLSSLILLQNGYLPFLLAKEARPAYIDALAAISKARKFEEENVKAWDNYYTVMFGGVERAYDMWLATIRACQREHPEITAS